ncbi:MAG: outer membrane beta-barrel protein [Xanthobacteraceae bacterium]
MRAVLFASSIALALASGSALAADLSLKGPPPAAALSWTGCYIDGGVGYGMWNQDHYAETSGLVAGSVATTDGGRGWLGRVGAGCDYQVSPSIVVGAFGDYDWMGLNGTSSLDVAGVTTSTTLSGIAGNESETGAWSVGARIGYLVTPRLLSYFDGGYTQTTFGQVNYNNAATGAATGLSLPATTYKGWFIGGGTEYALNMSFIPIQGLFWRNEYRFDSYGSRDIALSGVTGVSEHADKYVQTVTTGVVWKFNFGGPAPLVTKD